MSDTTTAQQHAETLEHFLIASGYGESDLGLALRAGAEALSRSCGTCAHVRDRGGFLQCTDPSEANPMHWQSTFPQFSCSFFTAKEPKP